MSWTPTVGVPGPSPVTGPSPSPSPPPATRRIAVLIAVTLALVLLAAVVVVLSIRGAAVAGRAVAAPAPDRPGAGDCLLDDPLGPAFPALVNADEPLPVLRTAPCDGTRYGEVVSVGAGTDQESADRDGTHEQCWSAVHGYLGVPHPATADLRRIPVADVWSVLIGPDERQRAAGQDWSACVVHLPPTDSGNGLTTDQSLRGAWERPADAHLFSTCVDEGTLDPLPCEWAHGAEHVSYWSGDPTEAQESALADCRTDAVEALGSPAALDRGELAVTLVNSRYADSDADSDDGELIVGPEAVTADGEYFVDCLLVPAQAGRELTGPLRGLGDEPVPLR
ncbi:MAG TPA: hypothetical protein VIC62_22175 [Nakamurella sp.]|jgi:hypothetical protein